MKNVSTLPKNAALTAAVLVILAIAALVIRVAQIDQRPFHHDEGVNHYFLETTRSKGYYPYSHQNYHGPTHFYAIALTTWLFGEDSEQAMRLPPAIGGVLLLLPLLSFFRRRPYALFFSTVLISFSPSLIFFSRYTIHEVFFILFTLWLALAVYQWNRTHVAHWLYQGAVALSLLILTKETYVIAGFCLFWAYLSLEIPRRDITFIYKQRHHFAGAIVLLCALTILIVSGGFQWSGGVRELFLGVPQWVGRNSSDTGHHKEFLYYSKVLLETEPWLLSLPIVMVVAILFLTIKKSTSLLSFLSDERFALHRFLTTWAYVSFFLYSSLKYKMPWLIINITVPGALALSLWLSELLRARILRYAMLVGTLVGCVYYSWYYNFKVPYGTKNPFSYVHTSPGMMKLIDEIKSIWKKSPQSKILVATNQYWPMPYYFRKNKEKVAYIRSDSVKKYLGDYDVLVMDKKVKFKSKEWKMKYYRLADNQESHTFFRKDKLEY